jgi:hypothetical protein
MEKGENSSYFRYFFFLKKNARRSRAHRDGNAPSVSTRKSRLSIGSASTPLETTTYSRFGEKGARTLCLLAPRPPPFHRRALTDRGAGPERKLGHRFLAGVSCAGGATLAPALARDPRVAQSEPYVKSSSALRMGVQFCARALDLNNLSSFFCNSAKAVFLPAIPSDARRLSAKRPRPRHLWRTPPVSPLRPSVS